MAALWRDLSDNWITDLSKLTFANFTKLRKLYLKENKLRTCPEFVSDTLNELYLTGNKMNNIPHGAFEKVLGVKHLWLDDNDLRDVPKEALKNLQKLEYLNLDQNEIRNIGRDSFNSLSRLKTLMLFENKVKEIDNDGFKGLDSLESLNLRGNNLSDVPVSAIKHFKNLRSLELDQNPITKIPDYAFRGLDKLRHIVLTWEKVKKIGGKAFAYLPSLERLSLVNVKLDGFPNLTGTSSLQYLTLTFNDIKELPENLCQKQTSLLDLTLNFNNIARIPDLSGCSSLSVLKIEHNQIESIGSSLRNLGKLQDLTLKGNNIRSLESRTFEGVTQLQTLNLADNKINFIANDAFAPFKMIKVLDLSYSSFSVLPTNGLKSLETLNVRYNRELTEIPSVKDLPKIRHVEAYYPYHCCQFRKESKSTKKPREEIPVTNKASDWVWEFKWLRNDYNDNNSTFALGDDLSGFGSGEVDPILARDEGSSEDNIRAAKAGSSDDPPDVILIEGEETHEVKCIPEPADPFFPCDDLMDSTFLRVGVWIVFLLALFGNATVIFVIMARSSRIDVSRFLICNLAVADLCMGIYLGLLAIVDASTRGNFRSYGVKWQLSSGCKTAGFLAVLSSETSVFTLTVITVERYIAITHALDITKKMSLKKTAVVMFIGWCFALIAATLPLFDVSDYTKFSVCLPFETGDPKSLAYVTSVLTLNGTAFLVILTCYIKIYCAIRGSSAWNTNDFRTAQRMALLVFTDFTCWAPITFLSLAAAFGGDYVSLKEAKIFTVFVFPLNSCANPFLYAILTGQFKRDCISLCRKVKTSQIPKITSSKRKYSISSAEMRRNSQVSSSNGLEGMVARLRGREVRRNSLPPSMRFMVQGNKSLQDKDEREVVIERVTAL
ncbi:lutropin-choriogonadotropic hormone receptor-like isoform X2 [Acropora millepora]|uniref:lutropin-choriogonadotropic hormone receptor-like isoform X2 n=1 Tax=Acropora millepora TaxID=45264 RepID=UPI001CF1471B|nr:lutropin-choriogonadotropic hormone receptor-like isoform X2 [Acropora millepora]